VEEKVKGKGENGREREKKEEVREYRAERMKNIL